MATKEITTCDVYGTIKNVDEFTVLIRDKAGATLSESTRDLSPRALDRLHKFIDRGLTPTKAMAE